MKTLQLLFLSLFITIVPMQQSKAAVAGVVAIAGAPAVASGIALAGLGSAGLGLLLTIADGNCDGGACVVYFLLGAVAGVVLLDDAGVVEFNHISLENAKKIGIKRSDVDIYNSELEEVNMVFSEVSSELTKESTPEDAKNLWSKYSDLVSPETFSVMQALATTK